MAGARGALRRLAALCLLAAPRSAPATDAAGAAFLEANAGREGVVVLESGLQYKVLKSSGNASALSPGPSDPCVCHYEGTLIDGTVFDSSIKRGSPATFAPNQVIKGWTEALQLMREGDKWQLFIPSNLAYGDRGAGGKIKGGAALIFELELIKVGGDGGLGGVLGMLGKPVFGPVAGWHLALLAVLIGWSVLKGAFGGDGGRTVAASHILVKEEDKCKELLGKLQEAAKKDQESMLALFKELAGTYSTCPSGKQSGGSLGEFSPGQMVPAFDRVCWAAPVGEVQGPVQTEFGFHIILVTRRTIPDEAAKDAPKEK